MQFQYLQSLGFRDLRAIILDVSALTKTLFPNSAWRRFRFRNFNDCRSRLLSIYNLTPPTSVYIAHTMASWKASFAPLFRGAARLTESLTASNAAFSCKSSLKNSPWKCNTSSPTLTPIRRMASYKREKPHVNIGEYLRFSPSIPM